MSMLNYKTAKELVAHLELAEHVEGGWYRETYRAEEKVNTPRGIRNKETTIHYCLPSDDFSVWHKLIDLEETFFFHYGEPTIIFMIKDGAIVTEILADEPVGKPEIVVPPNIWFAIRPTGINQPSDYSLMSCRVIPGFEFEDLVIADETMLLEVREEFHKVAKSLLRTKK